MKSLTMRRARTPKKARILQQVTGQLKIHKEGHYVEYIDLRNDSPIKPAKGVKISRFETR